MPDAEELKLKARNFLEKIAKEVDARLGSNSRVVQHAVWWSAANPADVQVTVRAAGQTNVRQSGGHEREAFNLVGASSLYQVDLMNRSFTEQDQLREVLAAASIPTNRVSYGFLLPLVLAWGKLAEPLDLTHPDVLALLDEFAIAVIGGISVSRYRDVISSIDISGQPIVLEKGVAIRPIEQEEL